jgi:o-succinylbenzoate synthase
VKIRSVTLREVQMPLLLPFETSFGTSKLRRILLVEVDVDGTIGWGESVAGENPFYSPETVETAWFILKGFLWPMLKDFEFASAGELYDKMAHVRGHNMAKGGLEAAVWDAEARMKNEPLWKLLGGTRQELASGVSIGIKKSLEELGEAVGKELAAGYQRIKIKIKPGWDAEPVRRLRELYPRIKLMVDANSAYTLADTPLLQRLEGYHLMMIEQPLGWDDLYSHVELQRKLQTPICLDECIHGPDDAREAAELKACQIVNIKLGRVGGYTASRRVHDICQQHTIPVWCGGMLESGIGRAHNIALSTLPNFILPGDVSASARYWEHDIIEPEVQVTPQGTIKVPQGPGIGFTPLAERIEKLTVAKEKLP